jgi:hypothetical protein
VAKLGVAYLPSTISSDAGYADLPLALLGAPVDIGALSCLGESGPEVRRGEEEWVPRPLTQNAQGAKQTEAVGQTWVRAAAKGKDVRCRRGHGAACGSASGM